MNLEKRKALGRGLETLLPASRPAATAAVATAPVAAGEAVREIPLEEIERNPYQTRSKIEEAALAELAASIAGSGVVQPIVVRYIPSGKYQLIAGERRWLASKKAGKAAIPAIVRQVSNEQAMEMTIIENLQREDLNPIEQARAFERLGREFGLTQEQMSVRTGKERSSISNFLRLLKLPAMVQTMVEKDQISLGHAKALMPLDSPVEIERLAQRIVEHGLTVRHVEEVVAGLANPQPKLVKERVVDPNVREAENTLQRALGVRVTINDRKGKGKIVIEYSSLEDFDRILDALSGD
jgi:ParB family chromosome partitioning protein